MEKKEIGQIGENLAEKFLKKNKHKILARNFTVKGGEIDIVTWDKKEKEVVFVEVKTRTSSEYGTPEEAVNNTKKKRMERAAQVYLMKNNYGAMQDYRFDIVAIEVEVNNENIKNQARIKYYKYI
jgi:putative endonuclease